MDWSAPVWRQLHTMTDPKKDEKPTVTVTTTPLPPTAPTTEQLSKFGFTSEQMQFIQQLVISASITAAQAAIQNAPKPAAPSQNQTIIPQCEKCHQLISACKDKHVKMVVFPTKYPEFAEWFAGVKMTYNNLHTQYFATKDYSGFYHQRSDCDYGYGPKHGSIVFAIGLRSPQEELTDYQRDCCIYLLEQIKEGKIKQL